MLKEIYIIKAVIATQSARKGAHPDFRKYGRGAPRPYF